MCFRMYYVRIQVCVYVGYALIITWKRHQHSMRGLYSASCMHEDVQHPEQPSSEDVKEKHNAKGILTAAGADDADVPSSSWFCSWWSSDEEEKHSPRFFCRRSLVGSIIENVWQSLVLRHPDPSTHQLRPRWGLTDGWALGPWEGRVASGVEWVTILHINFRRGLWMSIARASSAFVHCVGCITLKSY